jgi:unsaturated rhamnogalacturonyl hydrolase
MKFWFSLAITVVLLSLFGCRSGRSMKEISPDERISPLVVGKLLSQELFSRQEFMMYVTDAITTLHYAEVCAAFGVTRFAGLTGDNAVIYKIADRYRNVTDSGLISIIGHVDVNVYGILPLELFLNTGNTEFLEEGIRLADLQWQNPLPDGMSNQTRYWIDDVYMIAILQVQAYRATGKEIYLERAALEVNAYLKKLQQPNGLFHHGENAPFYWGRGNGWVAAGLAELIAVLPEKNMYYDSIVEGYKKMMAALLKYQADDGMWRQLVDYGESWEESSATAMFGYAISIGVNRGILTGKGYKNACQKAWKALCLHLDEDGKLDGICAGTGQSTDVNYYLQRPRIKGDFHGQAPMLWFACSLMEGRGAGK